MKFTIKHKLIFSILIVIFIFILIEVNANILSAASQDPLSNLDAYEPSEINPYKEYKAGKKVGVILGTIRNVSIVIAVISLMLIGIKYILGSVEEKANYKKTMMPYIIGTIMVASGTTIVTFIYNTVR